MIAAKNLQLILSKGDNYKKNVPSRSAIYYLDTLPSEKTFLKIFLTEKMGPTTTLPFHVRFDISNCFWDTEVRNITKANPTP